MRRHRAKQPADGKSPLPDPALRFHRSLLESEMTTAPGGIAFIPTYPPGHDRAGEQVKRPTRCRCGRDFDQLCINPEWLNSPAWKAGARARFRETFEFTDTGMAWIPKACSTCERRSLALEARAR
jgi:hypothetical protein